MDQQHIEEQSLTPPTRAAVRTEPAGHAPPELAAPASSPTCACAAAGTSAGEANPRFVYAVGRIEPRFPSLSVEKEFAQAAGRADTSGLTDREVIHAVLGAREHRYLVRHMCWVMTIEGMETYILVPRDPADFDLLVDTLRSTPGPADLDCVIGAYGPIAPPEMCGLIVPIVAFDQIYSFDRDSLVEAIPRPDKMTAKDFAPAAAELFDRIMQIADNAGATDEHRALNYLAVRYHAIYASAAVAFARNASLTSVEVVRSRLSMTRNVLDVIFCYRDRMTDVTDQLFVRVDVTEEFPFLVTKLSPYYDR